MTTRNLFKPVFMVASICLSLGAQAVQADNLKKTSVKQSIKAYFDQCFKVQLCNGSYLIKQNGETLYANAAGDAHYSTNEQITDQHQFNLASVSKQFTAMAAMILAEENKLKFDDPVSKYIPSFPYPTITVRHLLNHTSGLSRHERNYMEEYRAGKEDDPIDNADILALYVEKKPKLAFEPGHRWRYSNTGYVFLATVVERASKQPFHTFMKERIFAPLGMTNTLVHSVMRNDKMANRVYGFKQNYDGSKSKRDLIFMDGIAGDGAIYSTTADLYKWQQGLRENKLVSAAMWQQATTPVQLENGKSYPYGFGVSLRKGPNGEAGVAHNGRWRAFNSELFMGEDETFIAMLSNNNETSHLKRSKNAVLDILAGKKVDLPKPSLANAMYSQLKSGGVSSAKNLLKTAKDNKFSEFNLIERDINGLGYFYMEKEQFDKAAVVFAANQAAFPNSANTYHSHAEALLKLENKEKAIKVLQQAIKIDPTFEDAIGMLKELGVDVKIETLKGIAIEPAKLKQYTGSFKLNPNVSFGFKVENNQLVLESPNGQEVPMVYMGSNLFKTSDTRISAQFKRDGDKISAVTVTSRGRTFNAKKS